MLSIEPPRPFQHIPNTSPRVPTSTPPLPPLRQATHIRDHLAARLVALAVVGLLLQLLDHALAGGAVLERELGHHLAEVVRPGVAQLVRRHAQPREELAEPVGRQPVRTSGARERVGGREVEGVRGRGVSGRCTGSQRAAPSRGETGYEVGFAVDW